MADYDYCEACEEIRQRDPALIVNGFSDDNCTHMQLNEGLNGDYDDCTDLNNLNDCLIGIMDDESEISAMCDWRDYIQKLIPNIWTVFKAIICAICGIWSNISDLWEYSSSYQLTQDGDDISLEARDGNHGTVTVSGGGGGGTDTDTKYALSGSGMTVKLTGSDGVETSYTVPGGGGGGSDVSYTLNSSGNTITLDGSDGSSSSVTVTDTKFQLHTKTYTSETKTIPAGESLKITVLCQKPSEYTDTLYPMALAGWEIEGTGVGKCAARYVQLTERYSNVTKAVGVFHNFAASSASVTFKPEVLWWGNNTQY